MFELSMHAERRMQQRGCNPAVVRKILEYADSDQSVGDNCRIYRVGKQTAAELKDDKIGRFAVIVNEIDHRVVTVLPVCRTRRGARYRRAR